MATPGKKLAESLQVLKEIQDQGKTAIKSSAISRVHRARLVTNGFLKEVTKGWYISTPSNEKEGDTTSWYTSYWHFCADYLQDRYGEDYFLSPEQSLQINTGNWTVPQQLIIRTTRKANHSTPLPHGTSLWHWESPIPKEAEFAIIEGLRILTLPSSLIYSTPTVFIKNPTDARAALAMITDASEIAGQLLDGGHSKIAGRLAGAFRNIGRESIADEIIKIMRSAGYDVRETDPFETKTPLAVHSRENSPYVNRIRLMWYQMRDTIIELFPKAPGLPADAGSYMHKVEELYITDAYHSLSIEKYKVTPALIDRVRSGTWDMANIEEDKKQADAMAARGYWQATQKVRDSIRQILNNKNSGIVVQNDHAEWYRELFAPSVSAGIIKPSDLAGYRTQQVYISGSKHVPLNKAAVRDVMPAFFELLQHETHPAVRSVLGHFIFVYIHPYMDGNGRIGRFLMNVMLASGGYSWTVIPFQQRKRYMDALENASVEMNIRPLAEFLAYLVSEALAGKPVADL